MLARVSAHRHYRYAVVTMRVGAVHWRSKATQNLAQVAADRGGCQHW